MRDSKTSPEDSLKATAKIEIINKSKSAILFKVSEAPYI